MKETVSANIGTEAFTLDIDAFQALKLYLDDIRSRLPESDTETMVEIEIRIAELLHEQIASPMRVVTLDIARKVMERMGAPSAFGEAAAKPKAAPEQRLLRRSRTNRSIAGVCGGLAECFDADATAIRLATLLLILFGGLSVWIYIICWIVIPEAPAPVFDPFGKNNL